MPVFEYKALNKNNIEVTDELEATSEKEVLISLQKMGYTPLSVTQKKGKAGGAMGDLFAPKVKVQTIVQFTRQLRTMLGAGINLLEALSVLDEQAEDKFFKSVLTKVKKEVESGNTLSSGMDQFPKVFSRLYVNTIRIGEVTGNLEAILERMEGFLVFDERTKKNIKKAIRYPSMVLVGVIGALFFFSIYVIPKFKPLFSMSKGGIPLPTKIVLGFSDFILSYGYILGILIVAAIIGLIMYNRTPRGKFNIHKNMW